MSGRLLIAAALLLSGCGAASPSLDPTRIYAEEPVQAAYHLWVDQGEPARNIDDKHPLQGRASWYGPGLQGNQTANGEIYDMFGLTAAHRTLPFGTIVRVRRPDTAQFVVVRINDRGPYVDDRIIDLSYGAAWDLGMVQRGVVGVELDIVQMGDGKRHH